MPPTQEVDAEPARLRHNRELATQYINSEPNVDRCPPVSSQVETVPIVGLPHNYAYNPSIISTGTNELLMAYRYHTETSATKIQLAKLDDGGRVLSSHPLDIPTDDSCEDPHLFTLEGKEMVSWVQSRYPKELRSVVKYRPVRDSQLETQPQYGKNDWSATEKNWVFFEYCGVWCKHLTGPRQIIFDEAGREWRTPGPQWGYGTPRGGTVPIKFGSFYLWFFHSTLWNELSADRWRYYIGAYITETSPPFRVVNVTRRPIICGSRIDGLSPDQRKECFHWKSRIVFCSGCVDRGDYFLLSLGVNDAACMLAKIKRQAIEL